jgi:hypothetical protein
VGEKSGKVASTIRVVPSGTTHSIFNHEDTEGFARGVKYYEFMEGPLLIFHASRTKQSDCPLGSTHYRPVRD